MVIEICEDCGKTFKGGPRAFLCPKCRKKRQSDSAKKRKLNQIGLNAKRKKQEGEG